MFVCMCVKCCFDITKKKSAFILFFAWYICFVAFCFCSLFINHTITSYGIVYKVFTDVCIIFHCTVEIFHVWRCTHWHLLCLRVSQLWNVMEMQHQKCKKKNANFTRLLKHIYAKCFHPEDSGKLIVFFTPSFIREFKHIWFWWY